MANPLARANSALFKRVNRAREWWELPKPLALLNLRAFRDELRELNLYDTRAANGERSPVAPEDLPKHRTYDGSYQDPADPEMGMVGSRFGRNAPPDATAPEPMPQMMEPSPREVSLRLLNRDTFKPATSLNVLAACWIQMENHDWFGHGENSPDQFIDVPLDEQDEWPDGGRMKVKQTSADRTRTWKSGLPPTYINTVTHWWDGSQIYGSVEGRNRQLRAGEDGKMAVEDGRLPNEVDPDLDGVDLTGFSDNYWIGLSLLHTLFVNEHNAICDHLKAAYPGWDDEKLFLTARLVNSALMAKIHTVEWTPGILANPVLETAMHANWYGALPSWAKRVLGGRALTEALTGIVGSPQEHHAAPYSITEEFVSVYRLHPLLPDDYEVRDHRNGALIETTEFEPLQGHGTRPSIDKYGLSNLLYSFGVANPGAITLHNHPRALQNHVRLNGDRVDLGTIDILRDRERGVRRYNAFREKLRKPRVERFEDLTANRQWAEEIREVYDGDIDQVDLQVGLLAEPLPPGFGFSDTAFRIFILMASRRLKSDRFFTNDYSPDVYTPEGVEWVEGNGMLDVLRRHHPELAPALEGVKNAFAPWRKLG
ncbi:MAG: peroxidase family protein [Actinomycetota bacterium]